MSGSIFISYRRSDSIAETGRIYDRLVQAFGREHVFKDVDDIPFGVDFAEYLDQAVGRCQVVLVVMGKTWLTVTEADGTRRLDNPDDFVRIEVESALARGIPVVPVVLEGARMPKRAQLPESLQGLARRNGTEVGYDPRFHRDMDRLVKGLGALLKVAEAVPEAAEAAKGSGLSTFSFDVVTVDERGRVAERRQRTAECLREDLGGGVVLEMVRIPGGQFLMGSPRSEAERRDNEGPQHEVVVPEFFMGRYAVTQAQWRAVAAMPRVGRELDADPAHFKGANRPVERVSWLDAAEFCQRLTRYSGKTYRLPSEAEWEYACRAGTAAPFHFGKTIASDIANYDGSFTYGDGEKGAYRQETVEVGSFGIANDFGLYDMHGNVWEWCQDHWHGSYQGAPTEGNAWLTQDEESRRVIRGGSWSVYPGFCRSASRDFNSPAYRGFNFGFRIVCVAPRIPR